ncbi:BA75_02105T0 [Komagataella pastoris]|uniref:BA75_02105T0 n=1 Tax=Komagataella pastoris TaxID=4922 RepID=A0A1B2JBH2_PICPA|nr:BA75_02105T0 [Komagataella pastoris]
MIIMLTPARMINRMALQTASCQTRHIGSFIRTVLCIDPPNSPDDPTPENRFHPWESSPSAQLRERAATIRAKALCPVTSKDIEYTCPYSGIPTHHSREAWEQDQDYHQSHRYNILKKVNIYEHDLRSGRQFPEFDFPQEQHPDKIINLTSWDTYFYTREFFSMDTEFQLAAVTKMLSYPMTIASLLHQYSPYLLQPKGPVTLEGLKSLAALRYTLYPESRSSPLKDRPMRFFILGARAESQLPGHVWKQLSYLFPETSFELHFIGPECLYDKDKSQYVYNPRPVVQRYDENLCYVHHTEYFHTLHEAQDFFPYDPYLDCFFLFHPGLASKEANDQWKKSIPGLLDSKCAIFVTGYHQQDIDNDYEWLLNNYDKDLDILFEKRSNLFGSTKWELNDLNPQEVFQFNQQIFGFRGKRYHATKT